MRDGDLSRSCWQRGTLAKQYGLLALPLAIIASWYARTLTRGKMLGLLVGGALTAVVFLWGVCRAFQDIGRVALELSGAGYLGKVEAEGRSLRSYAIAGAPVLLGIAVAYWWLRPRLSDRRFLTQAVTGAVVALCPLLVRHYDHYYFYTAIWVAFLLRSAAIPPPRRLGVVLTCVALIVCTQSVLRSLRYRNEAAGERALADAVRVILPRNDRVFVDGPRHLHWRLGLDIGCPELGVDFWTVAQAAPTLTHCCSCNLSAIIVPCTRIEAVTALGMNAGSEKQVGNVCVFPLSPPPSCTAGLDCPYSGRSEIRR